MLRLIAVLATVLALGVASCGGEEGAQQYPPSVTQNFMDACTAQGASQQYCACTLDEIQKEFSLEEYTRLEIQMLNTGEIPPEFAAAIAKCLQ